MQFLATNYTETLRLLQWVVIAMIFLFFLRVIRAVFVEVRPASSRETRGERRRQARETSASSAGRGGRGRKLYLEIVEPPEHVGQTFDLSEELTIGRSPDCVVPTTYDAYTSTMHARVFRRGDRLWVEDLGSTNGTFVNSERITKATRLTKDDIVQVGGTVFEVTR